MARSLTNNTGFAYHKGDYQNTPNTIPTGTNLVVKKLEPNDITQYGPQITTVPRNPISKNRQRRKGTTVDLDSGVEFEADLTRDSFLDFIEGFVFAQPVGPAAYYAGAGRDSLEANEDTTDAFVVDAAPANLTDPVAGHLLWARGFSTAANNGFHVVSGGSATSIEVTASTLVDETPNQASGASLEVAGYRGTSADLTWAYTAGSPDTATITSGGGIDFTTLGLTVGQFIHVGGTTTAGVDANNFYTTSGAAAVRGYGRLTSITSTVLTLDKLSPTLAVEDDAGEADTNIDLLFGRFIRNVSVDATDFKTDVYFFEAAWDNLYPGTGYEYAKGNFCDTLSFNMEQADKATVTIGMIGTDTDPPTETQASDWGTAQIEPVETTAYNTSTDFVRLRVTQADEDGLTTDFKSMTFTIGNEVSPEKVLAFLGARFMNNGNFLIDIETQVLFSSADVLAAIRNNETVTMDWGLRNGDGGFMFDVPSMTLGGGDREFPENETILVNLTCEAFEDETLGTSFSASLFPILPSAPSSI